MAPPVSKCCVPLSERIRQLVDKYSLEPCGGACDATKSRDLGATQMPKYCPAATTICPATMSGRMQHERSSSPLRSSFTVKGEPSLRARSDSAANSRSASPLWRPRPRSRTPGRARGCSSCCGSLRAFSCPPCSRRERTPSPAARDVFVPASPFISTLPDVSKASDSGRDCLCYECDRPRLPCRTPGLSMYLERKERKQGRELQRQKLQLFPSRECVCGQNDPCLCPYPVCPHKSRRPLSSESSHRLLNLESEPKRRSAATAYLSPESTTCPACCPAQRAPAEYRCWGLRNFGDEDETRGSGPCCLEGQDNLPKRVKWCSPLCRDISDVPSYVARSSRVKSAPSSSFVKRTPSPTSTTSRSSRCYCCLQFSCAEQLRTLDATGVSSTAATTAHISIPAARSEEKNRDGERCPCHSILQFYEDVIWPHCVDPAALQAPESAPTGGRPRTRPLARAASARKRPGAHRATAERRAAGAHDCPSEVTGDSKVAPEEEAALLVLESLADVKGCPLPDQRTATSAAGDASVAVVADGRRNSRRCPWTAAVAAAAATSATAQTLECRCSRSDDVLHHDPRWNDPLFPRPSGLRSLPPLGRRDWAQVRVAADVLLRARDRAAVADRAAWASRPVAPRWRLRERSSAPALT